MTIIPVGKLRLMVAQSVNDPLYDVSAPDVNDIGTEPIPDISPDLESGPEAVESKYPEKKEKRRKTLSDYIFRKLEEFGYPGRRLEEFKKKFVNENISPDGTKNITVEIPDKKYPDPTTGEVETIEAENLSSIVSEIEKMFGLHFNGAKHSDGKWIINLTSLKTVDEKDQGMVRDSLDEVYGVPSRKNQKTKTEPLRGFTLQEMIKMAQVDLLNKLINVIGDKDAS